MATNHLHVELPHHLLSLVGCRTKLFFVVCLGGMEVLARMELD